MPHNKRKMNRALVAFGMILMSAASASAGGLTHKLSSSVQLTVDAAASQATRIGSTYSVSGSNITAGTMGGLTASTTSAAATQIQGAYTVTTAGDAFSLSESFTAGDAVNTAGTSVTAGVVGTLPAFGNVTTTAGGVAGTLAGSVGSSGSIGTLTAGGAGTTGIGQFISEITVFD